MKAKRQQRLVKVGNAMCNEMHVTDVQEGDEGKLQSILERNALDEFLDNAVMADREFTAERIVRVLPGTTGGGDEDEDEDDEAGDEKEGDSSSTSQPSKSWTASTFEQVRIPKRPRWEHIKDLTGEQLDRMEKDAFLEWRRALAQKEEHSSRAITPFEKNLQVWRQLWRVVERSDVVVQIVDARNPLLFRCEDLGGYVAEMAVRQGTAKAHILVINKADFLPLTARKLWKSYLDDRGIPFVFWSARLAEKELNLQYKSKHNTNEDDRDKERRRILSLGREMKGSNNESAEAGIELDDERDADVSGSTTRILSRTEILRYFENLGRNQQKQKQGQGKKGRKADNDDDDKESSTAVTVGMIGYPNVGKSSTVNVLMGEKKVSVSATPGKTKHFQTLEVHKGLRLCDCPGLVFPTFMRSKAALVVSGIFPIAQLRDHISPVHEVVSRVTRQQLHHLYALTFPVSKPVTAELLLSTHARMRGFMKDHGRPDTARSARIILSDFVNGKLVFAHPPPNLSRPELRAFLIAVEREKMGGVAVFSSSSSSSSVAPTASSSSLSSSSSFMRHRDGSSSSQLSFPKGKEVWGNAASAQGDGDTKKSMAARRGGAAASSSDSSNNNRVENAAEDYDIPLAAGQATSKGKTEIAAAALEEDGGLLNQILDDDVAFNPYESGKLKPNTNKKMSKRERRRLRKLNKMSNQARREVGFTSKKIGEIPGSSISRNGNVVAVPSFQ